VLLVNDSTSPLFAELWSATRKEPRCEPLLPWEKEWVGVPTEHAGGERLQLSAKRLNIEVAAHLVLDIPASAQANSSLCRPGPFARWTANGASDGHCAHHSGAALDDAATLGEVQIARTPIDESLIGFEAPS